MKNRFLNELRNYLAPLSQEERDEILRFYEERFSTSMIYEGKSEQEILDELESPRQIARNVLEEYGYSSHIQTKEPLTETQVFSKNKMWELVWLALFDIFVVAAVASSLLGVFLGLGGAWLGLIVTLFIYPIIKGTLVSVFIVIIGIGIAYLWLLLLLWIYDLALGFFTWLLRWHLKVLNYSKVPQVTKFLKRFLVSDVLKRSPNLRKLKMLMSFVAIIAIIFGSSMIIFSHDGLNWDQWNVPLIEVEYLEDVTVDITSETAWTINSDIDLGTIKLIRTTGSNIRVVSNEREEFPVLVTIDTTTREIHVINKIEQRIVSINFLWNILHKNPSIVIEIPENLPIDAIYLEGMNGSIQIENFDITELMVNTMNSVITVSNINVEQGINLKTTNGEIHLRNVTANTIEATTTNGRIRLNTVNALNIKTTATNGELRFLSVNVDLKNGETIIARTTNGKIELEDVYTLDVDLKTTNGSIEYTNTDLSFILDRLRTSTTNGTVHSNVPKRP